MLDRMGGETQRQRETGERDTERDPEESSPVHKHHTRTCARRGCITQSSLQKREDKETPPWQVLLLRQPGWASPHCAGSPWPGQGRPYLLGRGGTVQRAVRERGEAKTPSER